MVVSSWSSLLGWHEESRQRIGSQDRSFYVHFLFIPQGRAMEHSCLPSPTSSCRYWEVILNSAHPLLPASSTCAWPFFSPKVLMFWTVSTDFFHRKHAQNIASTVWFLNHGTAGSFVIRSCAERCLALSMAPVHMVLVAFCEFWPSALSLDMAKILWSQNYPWLKTTVQEM